METETDRIPARSRREAMDWSLVLLSQGIEPVIEREEDTSVWSLIVPAAECEDARTAIHLYQLENRRWPWRREILQPGLLFDWGSLAWVALVVFFYWTDARKGLSPAGVVDSMAVRHSEWWRLFTGIWLHADLAHLAGNAVIGLVLLGLTMARYGTGAGLLAAYLAGAGGNLAACLLSSSSHLSLGASGMVMGALGLLAAQTLNMRWARASHLPASLPSKGNSEGHPASEGARVGLIKGAGGFRPAPAVGTLASAYTRRSAEMIRFGRPVVTGVLGGVLLFVLLGLSPGTDVIAHAGGFLAGIVLGAFMKLSPGLAQRRKTNLFCGVLFLALVLWPWWLALRGR